MRKLLMVLGSLILLSALGVLMGMMNQQKAMSQSNLGPPSIPPTIPLEKSMFVFPDAESAEIFIKQNGIRAFIPRIEGFTVVFVMFDFNGQEDTLGYYGIEMIQNKYVPAYERALKTTIGMDPAEVKGKMRKEAALLRISEGAEGEVKELMEKL